MAVEIYQVLPGSVCDKKGIRAGDSLISVNGNEIGDVLDYRFYCDEEKLRLTFRKADGREKHFKVKGLTADGLGLEFSTYLMDRQRSCKNKCVFCFIDQLPKGLRPSLYFKDDDARLSFLFGNYITLTNLSDHDVERIIKMHISPINASVHTMDPDLRVKMMKNPHAGEALRHLYRFSEAGIRINAQLVLCPGLNDGDALVDSLRKLSALESLQSVAAVPVGLTKYREGLYPLRKFRPEEAAAVIDAIDAFNAGRLEKGQDKLAYPSDEFFQLAGRALPGPDYYGDYPQLENGVGMLTLMRAEFYDALAQTPADDRERRFGLVTGFAAKALMEELAGAFREKFPNAHIRVHAVENRFFGPDITVAGLLTGQDILRYFRALGDYEKELLFPSVMFKSREEQIFLDDVSKEDIERELGVTALVSDCSADGLFDLFYAYGS